MAKIDQETLQIIIDILRSPADAINIVKTAANNGEVSPRSQAPAWECI